VAAGNIRRPGRKGCLQEVARNHFYREFAIPADSSARAVAFAMSQPEEVVITEILFWHTRQEL
jgi:NADP-dependent 3-hydroxy acid dehydrogenase YdfG